MCDLLGPRPVIHANLVNHIRYMYNMHMTRVYNACDCTRMKRQSWHKVNELNMVLIHET